MCALLVLLCVGAALAAPQGYEYTAQGLEPYHLQHDQQLLQQKQGQQQELNLEQQLQLQQLLQEEQYLKQQIQEQLVIQQQQQQQPQEQQQQQQFVVAAREKTVAVAGDNAGFQFANQLVQQAQQLVQYEQQEVQQQKQQQQQQQQQQSLSTQSDNNFEVNEIKTEQQQLNIGDQPQEYVQQQSHQFVPINPPIREPELQIFAPRPQPQVNHQQQPHRQQQQRPNYEVSPVRYNKEFYYLSAPQDDSELPQDLQQQLNQIKHNLRVVFIRAPENNGISEAALALAKQSADSQTAIYVLTKQHDANELANKFQQVRAGAHKPQVVFVKYRTPQEADEAQRTIQAQYTALDGPNHFNHDGVVPSHNFIGSTSTSAISSSSGSSSNVIEPLHGATAAPATKYLPPKGVAAEH